MANTDVFSMSDEEFSKLNSEDIKEVTTEQNNDQLTSNDTDTNITNSDTTNDEVINSASNNSTEDNSSSGSEDKQVTEQDKDTTDESNLSEPSNTTNSNQDDESTEKADLGTQSTTTTEDTDKLSWYEKLTKPFIANGKEFTVKSPEESIKLMQKGLNYTKKMQALANDRKLAETFRANRLTTQDIGLLLDLKSGNKEAIKQLLKQTNIDPNDLVDYDLDENSQDASKKPAYQPTAPTPVSDQYLTLKDHIEEIASQPNGQETINLLVSLDDVSKDIIYKNPNLADSLYRHHFEKQKSGLTTYQEVVNEMDRMKALGELSENVPFVVAYKYAGDKLYGAPQQTNTQTNNGYLGSSRDMSTAKPNISNTANKVKQAVTPKSGSAGKTVVKDIFSMSDEEFAKMSM